MTWDYIAEGLEAAMARTFTTDAADTRKLSSEDEEAFLNDFAGNIRTGTIDLTPDDNFT
jgi:hypothetical protein